MAENRKVISLFSGAMGLDLGLEQAGLEVAVCQDIDPWCCATIRNNGHRAIEGDIKKLSQEDPDCLLLMREAGVKKGEAFLVCGGPPCQSFSTAGRRQAIGDPRGSLFIQFCQFIDKVRPRFFVMENVKGLLSAAICHRPIAERDGHLEPGEQPGSAMRVIQKELESLGYSVIYGLLDAVNYGVPQFRERLIVVGSRDREDIFLPVPTHFQRHQNAQMRWRTLKGAISDLEEEPGPCGHFSRERQDILRFVPPGKNWMYLRDVLRWPPKKMKEIMGGAYEAGGGKVGFYRRLAYDQPSPTLISSPLHKGTMLCHPNVEIDPPRPLSVREYARCQQFPDKWELNGSPTQCYRQIGNAIPVGLGKAIGHMLLSVADGTAQVSVKRVRGTSVHSKLQEALSTKASVPCKPKKRDNCSGLSQGRLFQRQ